MSKIVAKEHILPSALGGKLTTLTCRECNNSAGTNLESHLVQRVLLDGGKRHPLASVDFGGARIRAEFSGARVDEGVIEIGVIGKQSNPKQIEKAIQSLSEENWSGRSFKVNLELGYNERRSDVALVRSAYLYMFWTLGYIYVLDPSVRYIRELLHAPLTDSLTLKGVQRHAGIELPTNLCFAMATEPPEIRDSIRVFLRLDKDSGQIASVALPPSQCDSEDFYRKLEQFGNQATYEGFYTRSLLNNVSDENQREF